jgi:2-phosphoglycerate kinase
MIYLIGGAPRCGKTILSKKLAIKHGISWISTDSLQVIVQNSIAKSELRRRFPFLFLPGSESLTPQESLSAELVESRSAWPGIKAFVIHQIQCHQDCIVEGVHLLPQLVYKLHGTPYWKHLRVIYLIKEDEAKIADGLIKNAEIHDWLRPSLNKPSVVMLIAKMIQLKSRYLKNKAKEYKFKVVNTENNFKESLEKLAKEF